MTLSLGLYLVSVADYGYGEVGSCVVVSTGPGMAGEHSDMLNWPRNRARRIKYIGIASPEYQVADIVCSNIGGK